ncbi:putative ribonuclease H-like domain-containing protein [Tanacetum coccineum]
MELESTNSGPTVKLPILKLGEYEMWAIRIKQYFQIQDYALWEVIENGDSWVLVSQTSQENGITVTKMSTPATAEEKTNKKNDVKARGLLLMALPNEHQLTFSQYPDAKSMFAAIETRFGGNAATKKTQKTLLKQQYENFSATSAESLDSIFNRLQKIVSRLAILGVIIAQEDLNLKFLSSLPPEWNTHVVVWMNKPEVETMSIDDLYNNFKIVEQKVKKTVGTSSGGQNLAFMTAPSSSSTNDANTACSQVSAASPSVNTASPQVCTASVSDNTVYAFMVENPNGSNVLHQDLEQIHEDDLEAMDLKWQLSLLSVRAKKYYQRTGKKIFINGNDIAGYDKSKVECYNCHKLGHFARECRASRSKEDQFRNQDNTRKQGNKEDTSKAMLAIDGVGFDWSDMAEEQVQTNMALMAFLDSENEVLFSEEVAVLKREVGIKQYEINTLKTEFEKLKQEKDAFDFKIKKFNKASKDLDQLLGSQITDNSKKGFGYSAVPPPHPLIYNRPNKLDLSYSGLDEFKEPEFKGYGPENSKKESNVGCEKESDNSKENSDKCLVKEQESQVKSSFVEGCGSNTSKRVSEVEPKKVRENNDAPIIEDWVSDDEEQDESMTKPEKKTVIPTTAKIEKLVKKSVRYAEMYRSKRPRGNQRNWNGQKSNQLGSEFVMYNKACFNCGNFKHVQKNCTYHQKKKVGKPQHDDKGFVDSGCSRHMTGNIAYLSDFKQFDGGYVAFGGGAYGGKNTGKGTLKTDNLDFEYVYFVNELKFNLFSVSQMCDKKNYVLFIDTECLILSPNFKLPDENHIHLKIPRKDNMYSFDMKNIVPKETLTCLVAKATLDESMHWHRRLGHINFKNINKLVKDNLVRRLPTKHFENDQTCVACLKGKQHRASCKSKVLNPITKPLFMLHMDLFGPTFRKKVLREKYSVEAFLGKNVVAERRNRALIGGKFDGKSDEGFFVGYSLSSKAFRVYNTRTKRVEENLHIRFLENKPMIEGTGPKWLFDIDSLTQSMNYVPVTAGTVSNDSAGTSEENSQDCIVMPIWKDTSYFDSPTKDVDNGEPKTADDAQKQVEDGLNNENAEQERFADDSSTKDVNVVEQQVNTASPDVNTGSLKLNVVGPSVSTASPNEEDNTEEEPEVDLGNITNSYIVPTTPNTRIHKDHPIDNVIGEVQSTVQTRRMSKPTSEQGFLSDFEPTSIAKALSDSSWKQCRKNFCNSNFNKFRYWWISLMERRPLEQNRFKRPVHPDKFKGGQGTLLVLQQAPKTMVYVDDIIFGSTNKELCTGFEKLMKDKFQMSSMGELTFFLGLQCKKQTMVATSTTEAEYVAAANCCGQVKHVEYLMLNASPFEVMFKKEDNGLGSQSLFEGRIFKRRSGHKNTLLVVPLTKVGDEAVHKELGDKMERAATTASSLEAE